MDVSSALPALRRKAFVAVGLAALVSVATPAMAQDPAPAAQAAPQQDPLKFTDAGEKLIIYQIKPEREADFEAGWKAIKAALAASPDQAIKAFGDSFTINKVDLGAASPVRIFVFRLSPTSTTYSYNHVPLLFETLKAPAPDPAAPAGAQPPPGTFTYDQAQELYKKIHDAWAPQGISTWPLIKIG
jgi:hypothetical protein